MAIVAGSAVTRYSRQLLTLTLETGQSAVSAVQLPTHRVRNQLASLADFSIHYSDNSNTEGDKSEEDVGFGLELLGINLRLMLIFTPVFLYLILRLRKLS